MPQIIDYCVVRSRDPEGFEAAVKEHMAEGWVLQGGVSTCIDPSNLQVFAQAMIKTRA